VTGLCPRLIVHNRTHPVIPGAYWSVTGRCLYRVRSFDHRVRSSRKKRISPLLTVRSDLVRSLFIRRRPYSTKSRAPPYSPRSLAPLLAEPPHHRRRVPLLAAAPCRPRPRVHAGPPQPPPQLPCVAVLRATGAAGATEAASRPSSNVSCSLPATRAQ
jgi:hypothetical protein